MHTFVTYVQSFVTLCILVYRIGRQDRRPAIKADSEEEKTMTSNDPVWDKMHR